MSDKRRLKRYSIYLNVYLQENDKLLGYAENIHTEGLLLTSSKPIPDDQDFDIWVGATKEEKFTNRIFLSADRVWKSSMEEGKDMYYSGLHFNEPSDESVKKIKSLLAKLEI